MKKKRHYSSHLQLQYLIQKYKINIHQLMNELELYYGNTDMWIVHETKYNKVTRVDRVPNSIHKLPNKKVVNKPIVTIKPKRRIVM